MWSVPGAGIYQELIALMVAWSAIVPLWDHVDHIAPSYVGHIEELFTEVEDDEFQRPESTS